MRSRRRESRVGFNSRGCESGVSHLANANLTMSDAVCRILPPCFGFLPLAPLRMLAWSGRGGLQPSHTEGSAFAITLLANLSENNLIWTMSM